MVHSFTLWPTVLGKPVKKNLLDISVFNPRAPSNQQSSLTSCYCKQESVKKCAYEQRVREIVHASFTSLVLSTTGGVAKQATAFYKRLACCLATEWGQSYSSTMAWLHCHLTSSLLHSATQCIRGAHGPLQQWPQHQGTFCWPGHLGTSLHVNYYCVFTGLFLTNSFLCLCPECHNVMDIFNVTKSKMYRRATAKHTVVWTYYTNAFLRGTVYQTLCNTCISSYGFTIIIQYIFILS